MPEMPPPDLLADLILRREVLAVPEALVKPPLCLAAAASNLRNGDLLGGLAAA